MRIPDPERRYDAYPFELSGGQCQRVMIALALACNPQLLIADEPTTGLDVTTQAAIMDLVRELARERQMATIFITHDLALASEYCDRIVVMHAGHVVEVGPDARAVQPAPPSLHRPPDRLDADARGLHREPLVHPGQSSRPAARRPAAVPLPRALRARDRGVRARCAAGCGVRRRAPGVLLSSIGNFPGDAAKFPITEAAAQDMRKTGTD